jgi:hypothetical protein
MEEQVESEWENELAESIIMFCATSSDATAIVVDGTAVRKKNRYVLISGGFDSSTTDIYDTTNYSVKTGPSMRFSRYNHASVTLPDGDVAMFGGYNFKRTIPQLSFCEVFNVKSNSFYEIGDMLERRNGTAAVLLPNGLVLLIGGFDGSKWLNTCEFFNPADKTFSRSKAKLMTGRTNHSASLLPDGTVLVCGGWGGSFLQTTEIYDPTSDSFSAGTSMTVARTGHTATTLEDGRILLALGENGDSSASTELYDPATDSFTSGPTMLVARYGHFSCLLPDGRVLIGGGDIKATTRTTEIFDPTTYSVTNGFNLRSAQSRASAALF